MAAFIKIIFIVKLFQICVVLNKHKNIWLNLRQSVPLMPPSTNCQLLDDGFITGQIETSFAVTATLILLNDICVYWCLPTVLCFLAVSCLDNDAVVVWLLTGGFAVAITCLAEYQFVSLLRATLMDKSSLGGVHVQGGLVNEAAVYEVSHHGDHPHATTVDGLFFIWNG